MPVRIRQSALLHANDSPGRHAPSWYAATCELPPRAALERHLYCDVCVIGGGYTGLAAAGELARRGHSVALLEAHRVGWGASGRNGGQLGSGFNVAQDELERRLGGERAHALWAIAEAAKARVRALGGDRALDLEYRPGIVTAGHRARDVPALHRYCDFLAREYGATLEPLDRAGLRALVASDAYHGGALDPSAGHLHPLRLAALLAREAEARGAVLYERSEAIRIEGAGCGGAALGAHGSDTSAADGPVRVVTARGSVRAERLVLAGNGYLDLPGAARDRIMPINNFILVTEPLGERAEALLPGDHAVADSRFVVNYFRRTPDGRLLFGGGESYGYRFPEDLARRTRRAMLGVFPELADVRTAFAWGGTLAITRSRLPHVARLSPRVLLAGGYSGHGVALAVATGEALAAAIDGEEAHFELLAALPTAPFPGGHRARPALLAVAMTGASWLDRF